MNIIIRALMYMVQTYHDYFNRTKQNWYKSKKVKIPVPENSRLPKETILELQKE